MESEPAEPGNRAGATLEPRRNRAHRSSRPDTERARARLRRRLGWRRVGWRRLGWRRLGWRRLGWIAVRFSLASSHCPRDAAPYSRLPPPPPLPPLRWAIPTAAAAPAAGRPVPLVCPILCACRLGGTASAVCQSSEQGGEAEGGRQGSMRRRLKTLASRWRCEDASSSATRHSAEFDTSTSALFSGVSGGGRLWPFVVIRRASQYHTSFVCQISIAIT